MQFNRRSRGVTTRDCQLYIYIYIYIFISVHRREDLIFVSFLFFFFFFLFDGRSMESSGFLDLYDLFFIF